MVIIATMSFPPESRDEMKKRFLEQPPLPEGITIKGHYTNTAEGEGIKTIVIYEVDQSKFVEGMLTVNNRYVKYYGVPGFSYSVQPWLEIKEALKLN
jgi:hypothetical protein